MWKWSARGMPQHPARSSKLTKSRWVSNGWFIAKQFPAVLYLSFSNGQISKLCYLWIWDGPLFRCFYGQALVCRHTYTRRHNTIKDTLTQTAFRRCGMTVVHEPHNIGSIIDLISMLNRLILPTTSPFFRLTHQLMWKALLKTLALQFSVAKPKNTSEYDARLAAIGPGCDRT